MLSGESISVAVGSLSAGQQVQGQFDVVIDSPFPKGDTLVQNQATVSVGLGTPTTSAPVDTPIDRAPQVTGVYLNSTAWQQSFRDYLAATGQGDATLGYRIPGGSQQLGVLPWSGINEISVTFSEQVAIQLGHLQLIGVQPIGISGFHGGGNSGTWTLAAPLNTNNVRALVSATVTDFAGNQALDGEWIDGVASYNSGNGMPGGDFSFRFNTVVGDGNRDTVTSITDVVNISSRMASGEMITGAGTSTPNYSIFFDMNGDGAITVADRTIAIANMRKRSPGVEPGGTPGSGWLADATPTVPRPPSSPGTLDLSKQYVLLNDVDGDGQADPGDTLRYTVNIANNSASAVASVQFNDTIDANTTLQSGSVRFSPNITSTASPSVPENTTFVVDIQATDPDGQTENGGGLTYGFSNIAGGGADNNLFTLNLNTGLLSFTAAPNFENPQDVGGNNVYNVQVSVTDTSGMTGVQNLAVTVTNVNEAPTAVADSYNAIGNVGITVAGSANGLLGNDTDPDNNPSFNTLTITAFNSVTTNGGTVSGVNASTGEFTYVPPVGFEGLDTFTYTISDGLNTSQATVSINVADVIWFINNTGGGTGGSGTIASPFRRIEDYNSSLLPEVGDHIYLAETGTNYTAGLTLRSSQRLIGEGATGSLATLLGITLPTHSIALPVLNAANNPRITTANANGITLAANNTIRGVDIGNTGSGTGLNGSNFGTATIAEVGISGTGRAINLATGTLNATFEGIASTSGVNGINISGVAGTASFGNTSISGASGTGVNIANATGTFNFADLDVTTTNLAGIVVSTVGTVTSTSGTISTGSARAVEIRNTNLGMTLTSVSVNGASVGIELENTTGSFSIVGDGGTIRNNSGGVIQNVIDSGVKLTNVNNVSLARMQFTNSNNFGLNGTTVNGLTIDRTVFNGSHGNAINEGAIYVTNWLGTGTISNSDITGGANDTVRVTNSTGSLNRLTISNTDIRDHNAGNTNANHGLRFATNLSSGQGSGVVMNLTVNNSRFTNNKANHIDVGNAGQASMDIVLNSNTFATTNTAFGGAVNVTNTHQGQQTFDINGNQSTGSMLSAFNVFTSNLTSPTAAVNGQFRNNTVGTSGVSLSGSRQGSGFAAQATGLGKVTLNIASNTIRQFFDMGIIVTAGDTSPVVNATITGNTVKEGDTLWALNGIHANIGTTSTGAVNAYLDIRSNDVAGSVPGGSGEIRVRQRNSSTVRLPGISAVVGGYVPYMTSRNTIGAGGVSSVGTFVDGGPFLLAANMPEMDSEFAAPSSLTQSELLGVAGAAIGRLAAAGASAAQVALMSSLSFQVVDLSGAQLGVALPGAVLIDINGAGWGYFVDDTVFDDSEFESPVVDSSVTNKIDLLTVVLHELAHILGHEDGSGHRLMNPTLETGVRHLDLDALFAKEDSFEDTFI